MPECLTPYYVKANTKHPESMSVPCGNCPACYSRRISGWSFRLMQEDKYSSSAWFITLTYAPHSVPYSKHGFKTLVKSDVQKFLKRLRKLNENTIKYYAVGEYGSETRRPHYHLIIFNADFKTFQKAWSLDNRDLGQIYYGGVSEASVGYTLKYMCKPKSKKKFARDDRQLEFALMSKGLGKSYLTPAMIHWHHNDVLNRMYINIGDGKRAAMPRYYKNKIYAKVTRQAVGVHTRNKMLLEQKSLVIHDLYYWEKLQSTASQFRKMELESLNRQHL